MLVVYTYVQPILFSRKNKNRILIRTRYAFFALIVVAIVVVVVVVVAAAFVGVEQSGEKQRRGQMFGSVYQAPGTRYDFVRKKKMGLVFVLLGIHLNTRTFLVFPDIVTLNT